MCNVMVSLRLYYVRYVVKTGYQVELVSHVWHFSLCGLHTSSTVQVFGTRVMYGT